MRDVTRDLIHTFRPTDIDWMGYKIDSATDVSFHHIVKKSDGGLYVFDNGALLRQNTSHEYTHLIEAKDPEMFAYINNLLKNINTQRYKPTKNQLLAIRAILEQFEREHCADTNSKGKPLIKTKYLETRKKL